MKSNAFRSIRMKLTQNLIIAFASAFFILIVVGSVISVQLYNHLIYNQLEQIADAKKQGQTHTVYENDPYALFAEELSEMQLMAAHFDVDVSQSPVTFTMDQFTKRLFTARDKSAIYKMSEMAADENQVHGNFEYNEVRYFYYMDRSVRTGHVMVFYFTHPDESRFGLALLVFILLVALIIPVAQKISSSMVQPILELEVFAEQIAERKWDAPAPETENDEIGLLADALDKMRHALRKAEERDKRFLQAASHDLKTPIMIIKGYAQAMVDNIDPGLKDEQALIISQEATKLERRVLQLLRINTLEHTLLQVSGQEPVRVDRLLRSLSERFKTLKGELTWRTELIPMEIEGHSEALLIAFENLMENQLRFAKSVVEIKMVQENQDLCVYIANDGPPFDTEDPNIYFDPYRKGIEGKFGLGLSIAKRVILAHGGNISASSLEEGEHVLFEFERRSGVLFKINLPLPYNENDNTVEYFE